MTKGVTGVWVGIRRGHLVWVTLLGVLTPAVSVTAFFYSAKAELNQKIDTIQLENVKTFAKQTDLQSIDTKLNNIGNDVSVIRGYLRPRHGLSRSRDDGP